jgi:pyruvate dehydrogenase E2 component (dihydrolipoamide acetyltransferase)
VPKEIIMPKFGFAQEESEILEWLSEEGDKVEKGDPVAVVSTDKISMEVEAPETGILSGIRYQIGDTVPVTEIIAYILQPGEKVPEIKKNVKSLGESKRIEEKAGKSATPLAKKLIEENLLDIHALTGTGENRKIIKADVEKYLSEKKVLAGKIKATPAARRIGIEENINLSEINGSGPEGRIQADDVKRRMIASHKTDAGGDVPIIKTIPLIGMRRTIAKNMQRSMQEAPHMTLQIDIPMDALENLRKEMNAEQEKKSEKISLTAFITKAVALSLKRNPILNSQYSEKEIKILGEIHIGIATALDEGLIVPVIHNADRKDIHQISKEIINISKRARKAKLKQKDLSNGTFTISNLGMYDIDRFTAIINPPQSAILAVGKMNRYFVPMDNNIPTIQKIITFNLSADHRVMDGVQAAKFLSDLKNLISEPKVLLK